MRTAQQDDQALLVSRYTAWSSMMGPLPYKPRRGRRPRRCPEVVLPGDLAVSHRPAASSTGRVHVATTRPTRGLSQPATLWRAYGPNVALEISREAFPAAP
jgi:hypothetical protein